MESDKTSNRIKIVLLGDAGVGKSSLLSRLCKGLFSEQYDPTIGSDFMTCVIDSDSKSAKANIWDISGHPEYAELRKGFYKNADALLLVFDVTKAKTFEGLEAWILEARKLSNEKVPVWVVGNKIDSTGKRAIDAEIPNEWAKAKACRGYFETSAATGHGVNELFSDVVDKLC